MNFLIYDQNVWSNLCPKPWADLRPINRLTTWSINRHMTLPMTQTMIRLMTPTHSLNHNSTCGSTHDSPYERTMTWIVIRHVPYKDPAYDSIHEPSHDPTNGPTHATIHGPNPDLILLTHVSSHHPINIQN